MLGFLKKNISFEVPTDMEWTMDDNGQYYERGVDYWIGMILRNINRPVFYDIGANFGYYSVKYHKYIKQGYAFEPVNNTYNFLHRNLNRNKSKKITAFNFGLSNDEQELLINIYNNSGCNTIYERNIPEDHPVKKIGSELITLKSLDKFITTNNLLPPDFIKVDVEGAELEVLQGSTQTILTHNPILLLEYSQNTSEDAGYDRTALLDFFDQDVYSFLGINSDEKTIELISFDDFDDKNVGNLIVFPIGKAYLFS